MIIFALISSMSTVIYFFYKNSYFFNKSILESINKYKKDISRGSKRIDFILILFNIIICAIASYSSSIAT